MRREMRLLLTLLFLPVCLVSFAQSRVLKGTVTDVDKEPLPGVSIIVGGTSIGTVTDFDGHFELKTNEDAPVLLFSFIGFDSQEIAVEGQTNFDVVLEESTEDLEEVVVVGYGVMKKSDVTGSVASVGADDVKSVASNRPVEALQGKVAGVNITKSSGRPGAGMKVRIRGVGSTNNSDPLYVVDGVPVGGDIEHISPEDIERIEVLKDASSTAIYGNRGANGVIIVTTKKGSVDSKPVFSFNGYYGLSQVGNKVDVLNAHEYSTLLQEAYANDGMSVPDDIQARTDYAIAHQSEGKDWQDEIYQVGTQQNYNLSVRGGFSSPKVEDREMTYSMSGTYFNEEGLVKNTEFDKYIFNGRLQYKYNKLLSAGLQFDIFHKEYGDFNTSLYQGVISTALRNSPLDEGVDANGNIIGTPTTAYTANPMQAIYEMQFSNRTTDSYGLRAWLQFDFTKDLNLKSTFNMSRGQNFDQVYLPTFEHSSTQLRNQSSLTENRGNWHSYTLINLLNYTKQLELHRISATLGHEAQFDESSWLGVTGYDVPEDENLRYLNQAKTFAESPNSGQSEATTLSYFGRAFYSYANKYMLTGTVRYDGSSKFAKDNRWGLFPSVGASWVVSEENFLKDVEALSSLKLRAGWGRVGNAASAKAGSDAATVGYYDMFYSFNGEMSKGGTPTNIPTPDLQWEIVETSNYGVDASLLDGALNVTADYFIKDTKDMITEVAVPGYYPKDRPNLNIGTMSNKGYEIAASYTTKFGDVKLNVGANFSVIDNEVTKLNEEQGAYIDGGYIDKLGNTTRTESGYEIAYFYGYETDGIFRSVEELDAHSKDGKRIQKSAKVGDIRFVDRNGNGEIDANDRTYLGSGTPEFTYGFNIGAQYKGFDFVANFSGVHGSEIVNGLGIFMYEMTENTNVYSERMDRYHPESNPTGTDPRMTTSDPNQNRRFSDRYVEDGSFLRLKTLQLGYTLPKALTQRCGLDNVRMYISGQNLFTWTDYSGYDPEVGDLGGSLGVGVDQGSYPQPKLYFVGINMNF